jgi:hypothetical protein
MHLILQLKPLCFYHHVLTLSYKITITYAILDVTTINVAKEIQQLLKQTTTCTLYIFTTILANVLNY